MQGRFLGCLSVVVPAGLSLLTAYAPISSGHAIETQTQLRLHAPSSNIPSNLMAAGIRSVINSQNQGLNVELIWDELTNDALAIIRENRVDLGLLDLEEINLTTLDAESDLQAVLKLWRTDVTADLGSADPDPSHLLIAQSSVPAPAIQKLIETLLSDHVVLKAAQIDTTKLVPTKALVDLPLAPHPGIHDYLTGSDVELESDLTPDAGSVGADRGARKGITLGNFSDLALATNRSNSVPHAPIETPAQTPVPRPVLDGQTYTVYFDSDKAELDAGNIESVAEACRYAATLPRARFVITGHTDTVGSESYNDKLAERRALKVANAIRTDPRFREALSVVEYGESMLAVPTHDEISEPRNRRVEITVVRDP